MSPRSMAGKSAILGFPRVSGDEPAPYRDTQAKNEFSPRERG